MRIFIQNVWFTVFQKVPEESISAKPLCDGHTSASIQQAQEEPFLAPSSYSRGSKQTNIF